MATIRTLLTAEESAELTRQRLGRRPTFNIHDAFQAIDKDGNGYLTREELRRIFVQHSVFATDREIGQLVERYDRNKDGRISYAEFMDEITPKSPTKL